MSPKEKTQQNQLTACLTTNANSQNLHIFPYVHFGGSNSGTRLLEDSSLFE